MKKSKSHSLEKIVIAVILGFTLLWGLFQIDFKSLLPARSPVQTVPQIVVKPSPTQLEPTTQTSSAITPDGKLKVILQTEEKEALYTNSFFITHATESGQLRDPFYTKTTQVENSFSIPFNSFSPDNNYFFLEEKAADGSHFLVFSASGKVFRDGEQFIDVTEKFRAYTSTYSLFNATGWAAEQLLIIQTKKDDQTTGPSFWFDLSGLSFIQLSTRF